MVSRGLLNLELSISSISTCFFLVIYFICHVKYRCASESHPLLCPFPPHRSHLPAQLAYSQSNHCICFFPRANAYKPKQVAKSTNNISPAHSFFLRTSSISLPSHPTLALAHISCVLSCLTWGRFLFSFFCEILLLVLRLPSQRCIVSVPLFRC